MAFTIDKIRRVTAYAATKTDVVNKDDILYTIKDVSNFSISNSAETQDAVDGQGNIIETYLRSKSAEMSGENAIFDMPLAATMVGAKIGEAASVKINFHDVLAVAKEGKEVTLSKTPAAGGEPVVVYVMNDDGTLGAKLEVGAEKDVTYSAGKLTFKTSPATDKAVNVFVPYTYEEASAVKFENFADAATIPSRVVVEGMGRDICDHHQVYFYITAPYVESVAKPNSLSYANSA